MATISNTPRPGYVWDSTDNVWYPIGVGGHSHPDYITQATAISPTTVDAKGDLLVGSAADTISRLAVGNSGEQIVADSSTSTGLRYQAHTEAGKNFIINGGQDVWQRGTSIATSGTTYTGDRFETWSTAGAATTTSRQLTNDTTNLPGIQYCARVQRNSGQTLTGAIAYQTSLETVNSIPLAGKPIVVSFYARAGANYSAASSLLTVKVITGTGTDQKVSGYTGAAEIVNTTVTLTTTWQRFSLTATVGATATEIGFQPYSLPTGTAGTNDYYEITGIQLELGSVASTFSRAGGSIQGELAACRRYLPAVNLSGGVGVNLGYAYTTNAALFVIPFDVVARTQPTGITVPTITGNFIVRNSTNGDASATTMTFDVASVNNASILTNGTLTAGTVARLISNASSGYILFTGCEL